MLTIEQIRKALGKEFDYLSDSEVEQIWTEMYNFWDMIVY